MQAKQGQLFLGTINCDDRMWQPCQSWYVLLHRLSVFMDLYSKQNQIDSNRQHFFPRFAELVD